MLDIRDGGYQIEHQEVADYANSSAEFDISDMKLEDFVISDIDILSEANINPQNILRDIMNCGSFQGSNGEYYEFGKLSLDDEEIDVVYHTAMGGFTILKFLPSGSSKPQSTATTHSKSYKNTLGGAWS